MKIFLLFKEYNFNHFPFYLGAFAALWQTSVHLFAKFNVSPFCQALAIPLAPSFLSSPSRWWQIILLRFLGDSIHPSKVSAPKLPVSLPANRTEPNRTGQLWLEFNKNGLMGHIFCNCHAPRPASLHLNKRDWYCMMMNLMIFHLSLDLIRGYHF